MAGIVAHSRLDECSLATNIPDNLFTGDILLFEENGDHWFQRFCSDMMSVLTGCTLTHAAVILRNPPAPPNTMVFGEGIFVLQHRVEDGRLRAFCTPIEEVLASVRGAVHVRRITSEATDKFIDQDKVTHYIAAIQLNPHAWLPSTPLHLLFPSHTNLFSTATVGAFLHAMGLVDEQWDYRGLTPGELLPDRLSVPWTAPDVYQDSVEAISRDPEPPP